MKKYIYALRDTEAGNTIESFLTLEEAEDALALYEEDDKRDGLYTEGFYEIDEQEMDDDDAMDDRMSSVEYNQFIN